MKKKCPNEYLLNIHNSRLTRWVDEIIPFKFETEDMPDAKMRFVDFISRQSNQKAQKVSSYDEEFAVAKTDLIFASTNSLNLISSQFSPQMNNLLKLQDPPPQITTYSEPAKYQKIQVAHLPLAYTRINSIYPRHHKIKLQIQVTIQSFLNIVTPRDKHQLILHSLNEMHLILSVHF